MGGRYGYRPGDFPVTERAGDCLLRLPAHNALTVEDLRRVVAAVTSARL
jgi:dTDP-4-amino-4,6-dideoxygalactose transaminase